MSHIIHTGRPVEDALTSDQPVTACLARLSVSKAALEMTDFINAELSRGTAVATLLQTLAVFQVQTHASVAANILTLTGIKIMQGYYAEMVADEYIEHGVRTLQAINERKMEGAL